MKITIKLPDKVKRRSILPASQEEDKKGVVKYLYDMYGKTLKRYRPLDIPPTCAFCAHVGEAQWHCHNPESPQCHLNVHEFTTCSKWRPNTGLMMFLHTRWFREEFEKQTVKTMKMVNDLEEHQKRPPNNDMKFAEFIAHQVVAVTDINECMKRGYCPKHPDTKLVDGKCMVSTLNCGMPDFIGDKKGERGCTMSPGGPGKMVDCWKCPECGFSIAKENKVYVEKPE